MATLIGVIILCGKRLEVKDEQEKGCTNLAFWISSLNTVMANLSDFSIVIGDFSQGRYWEFLLLWKVQQDYLYLYIYIHTP